MVADLEKYYWTTIGSELNDRGYAVLPGLMKSDECRVISSCFDQDDPFRSHIRMRRHGFGEGEYKYFAYPLPELIAAMRLDVYSRLALIANDWSEKLNLDISYPLDHEDFVEDCRRNGQVRPTPLLLRYGPGDYNRLHQDLYGDLSFPIQLAVLLDQPGADFEGGEFILTEQKPRSQSRAQVVPLNQGDGLLFAVNDRPAPGVRGHYRLKMRHGVSELRKGQRHVLGIIFHDAK